MTDKKTDEDKPAFFVSRRGRQVGVHEVDLGGIDIEKDKEQTDKVETQVRTKPAKQSPRPKQHIGWSRKKKTIITAIVIALLLLPVVLAELVAAQYTSGVDGAKRDLASIVNSSVLPAQKKDTISADQIRNVGDKVNDIVAHMCRGGLLDNAAQLYPRAKSAHSQCKAEQSKYAALASSLYALEAQARYLEKVDGLVKPVATPITDEYAVIGAQQTAWQAVADGIKELSPPDAMKSAHSELLAHMTATAGAWSKLNTANNSQDATAFQEAEKTLSSEYEAVRATSAQFTSVLADTQAKITASYNALK